MKCSNPDWIPNELADFARKLKNLKPLSTWSSEVVEEWNAHHKEEMAIIKRLLTDDRMEPVWKLFQRLPSEKRRQSMHDFISKLTCTFYDSKDLARSERQIEKLKSLKRKMERQFGTEKCIETKRIDTIEEIVGFCGELETMQIETINDNGVSFKDELKDLLEKSPQEVKGILNRRIKNYKRSHRPRIAWFIPENDLKWILTISRREQDYQKLFLREVASVLFRQLFGQPFGELAYDVSLVVLDLMPDTNTPAQKRSLIQNRRDKVRRRCK